MLDRRPWLRGMAVLLALFVAISTAACASSSQAGPDGTDGTGPTETDPPKPCPVDALDHTQDTVPNVAITAWAPFTGDAMVAFQQLVSSYNASGHGVTVTAQPIPVDPVAQRALYQRAATDGTLPALTAVDSSLTQFIVDRAQVVDASACLKAAGKETTGELPVARSAYTVDGKQWAASANLVTPLLYFRRGAFLAAGLDPDKPPVSLQQVHDMAKAMQSKGVASRPVALRLDSVLIENWLTGAGVNIVNHGNGRDQHADEGNVEGPKATQLFGWIQSMTADGLLELLPAAADGSDPAPATTLQSAAMTIGPSTAISDFAPTALGAAPDLDVAALPGIDSAGHGQVGGVAWYLTKDLPPEQIAAAWDFADFLNSVPSQVTWNLVGGYPPYNPRAVDDPGLVDAWRASRRGPWLDTAYTQITNLDPAGPGPLIGPYPAVRAAIEQAAQHVIVGTEPPADAITTADDAITAALTGSDPGNP
ncbi:MAG: extracellular solute-binding protein [Acidimicrobiales bacterium]